LYGTTHVTAIMVGTACRHSWCGEIMPQVFLPALLTCEDRSGRLLLGRNSRHPDVAGVLVTRR
jgi:hypothetical protein